MLFGLSSFPPTFSFHPRYDLVMPLSIFFLVAFHVVLFTPPCIIHRIITLLANTIDWFFYFTLACVSECVNVCGLVWVWLATNVQEMVHGGGGTWHIVIYRLSFVQGLDDERPWSQWAPWSVIFFVIRSFPSWAPSSRGSV
ncbi:hypothetical protein CC2G_006304 [Coprinopsis cinerea AmutBmut pab1-1]|nr:hypothetical protein CC2G_006304 [Coprinopsis cinerea AmutBmut pab1-1]